MLAFVCNYMKIFLLHILIFTILFFIPFDVLSQKQIKLNEEPLFNYTNTDQSEISINFNIPDFAFNVNQLGYLKIIKEDFQKIYNTGDPDLPVLTRLLAFPASVNPVMTIASFKSDTFDINQLGYSNLIVPAMASVSKSNSGQYPEPAKGNSYYIDKFTFSPVVEYFDRGVMRDIRIIELVYHPFSYNPVQNKITVRNNLDIKLSWNSNSPMPALLNKVNQDNKVSSVVNLQLLKSSNDNLKPTYIIVAPLEFKTIMQPFVKWKKQQGFNLMEAYLGQEIPTVSRNQIRNYIESIYLNPPEGNSAPEYILLVGDVSEVPTWSGVDGHATDLYYGEFTNDYLPECFVGRMSASSTDQLNAILAKTLYVERGQEIENQNIYNTHLLISGVDATYSPIYGNGAVNYFLNYYSTAALGISPKYYLYGSGSDILSNSSQAKEKIITEYNNGAGIVYYTAHCGSTGWTNPSFNNDDIASLSNTGKFPLMISNCCQSYMFNLNSFGENIVRAANKGAVAYIGATDYTYWDEDYFWAIGVTSEITANPIYEESGIGSWDAWFHTHNEPDNVKAFSLGQIVSAGNLAVQSSSSDIKKYYWETYGIMGDPSLIPSKFQTQTIPVDEINPMVYGQENLEITTIPGAIVTLFIDSLIAYSVANNQGIAALSFPPVSVIGEKKVEVVVTHSYYLPFIDTLNVLSPNRPYLVINKIAINDSLSNINGQAESGEEFSIYTEIKNISGYTAKNIQFELTTNSLLVESMNSNTGIFSDSISGFEKWYINNRCNIKLNNSISNNTKITLNVRVNYNDSLETLFSYAILVNAPEIEFSYVAIDNSGVGNLNGILDPGETASLNVEFINTGQMQVSNTIVSFSSATDDLVDVLNPYSQLEDFDIQQTKTCELQISIANSFFPGTVGQINYSITTGNESQYQFNGSFNILLGTLPNYNMTNNTTNEVINALFYDSGGPDGNYSNKENATTTFIPHRSGEGLKIDFEEFNIESGTGSCWDKLEIYDGINTASTKLGAFCNYNFKSSLMSQNADGALTFRFVSDGNLTKTGWKAKISSSKMSQVTFIILNNGNPVSDALINLENQSTNTNEVGEAHFDYILNDFEKNFTISKVGFNSLSDKIGKIKTDTIIYVELSSIPDVRFQVYFNGKAIEGANVVLENYSAKTDSVGEVTFIDLLPGRKYFKVSRTSFIDTSGYFYLDESDLIIPVSLKCASLYSVEFNITDDISFLNNATLLINDETITTNLYGKITIDSLYPDIYSYQVDCYGHFSHYGTFEITNSNLIEDIQINRRNFSALFNIYSNNQAVDGASINFSDTTLKTTALGQAYLNKLYSLNSQIFTIVKEGFNNYSGYFVPQSDSVYNINLVPAGIIETSRILEIFPNPASSNNSIWIHSNKFPYSIQIIDNLGQRIFANILKSKLEQIPITGFKPGIYSIQIQFKNELIYKNLIIY
jgi:hypothetical protein